MSSLVILWNYDETWLWKNDTFDNDADEVLIQVLMLLMIMLCLLANLIMFSIVETLS